MLTLISTVVGLSILILVHELGHFLAAKAVNIQVPRFSLGFGKRLAGFRIGETDFVLSAIPLGGYVKMAGMEEDEAASTLEGEAGEPPVDPERSFDRKPLWARTLVISAGVIMNLAFAFLVFSVLPLGYGETLHPDTRLSPPPAVLSRGPARLLAGLPDGARLTAVGSRPVASWEEALGALAAAPAGAVQLRFADSAPLTLQLPAAQDARGELLAGVQPYQRPVIHEVQGGSPAARGGLRAGDRVVQAGGRPVASWARLVDAIQSHPGQPLALTVNRDGRLVRLSITPNRVKQKLPDGRRVEIGRAGALAEPRREAHRRVGVGEAISIGARQTVDSAVSIATLLKQLLTGQISARNLGGIISIGEASGQSAQLGFDVWVFFLGLFSVNLAVLNLLPIPILDGGHLMFIFCEAVRGRPLSVETRIRLSQVGLVIVVALMLFANGNDLLRKFFGN